MHFSDCATNNNPAYPKGECDCGVEKQYSDINKPMAPYKHMQNAFLTQTNEELIKMWKDAKEQIEDAKITISVNTQEAQTIEWE